MNKMIISNAELLCITPTNQAHEFIFSTESKNERNENETIFIKIPRVITTKNIELNVSNGTDGNYIKFYIEPRKDDDALCTFINKEKMDEKDLDLLNKQISIGGIRCLDIGNHLENKME